MELKLQHEEHDFFEPSRFPSFSCETMRESIVPDSCPDIARIIGTRGQVCITGRNLTGDGRISVSGTVEASVLYIPEQGRGPRSLRLQLPFQCYSDCAEEGDWTYPDVAVCLESIDARMLNPRKILTRANILLRPFACRRTKLHVCTGCDEGDTVQLLCDTKSTQVVKAVREREFLFSEELALPSGREPIEELLSVRIEMGAADGKLIGNKIVVKGTASVSALYRDTNGDIGVLEQQIPFSQVLDGNDLTEEMELQSVCHLMGSSAHVGSDLGDDDGATISLELQILSRTSASEIRPVQYVADLYSTKGYIDTKPGTLELNEPVKQHITKTNIRETLETGMSVKTVLDTEVTCLDAQPSSRGIEIPVRVQCLYLDENNTIGSVAGSFTAVCPTELDGNTRIQEITSRYGDSSVNILPEGIELRIPIECTISAASRAKLPSISGGEWREAGETEKSPSLVLRKLRDGETLWSIAKQYRSTGTAILEANHISDETQLNTASLLLIPVCR